MKKTIVGALMIVTFIFYGAPAEASLQSSYEQQLTEITRQVYLVQIALLTYQLEQLNQLAVVRGFAVAAGTATQSAIRDNVLSIIVDGDVVVRPVISSLASALETCRESLSAVSESSLQECVYNDQLIYSTVHTD